MRRVSHRRTWIGAIAFATACLALGGPAWAQVRGGALTVATESEFAVFDPLEARVFPNSTITAATLFYETLFELDDNGDIQPRLALSMASTEGGKVWTVKLRPGVAFHDGTPFNAEAVAFNFNRTLDPKNKCPCRALFADIDRIEAVDELTVVFRFNHPWAALPLMLAQPTVVSLIASPTAIRQKGADYGRNPVGTGPFIFKSWARGDRLIAERNPHYWRKDRPYLDRVTVRPITDPPARFASLLAGETDVIWHDRPDDIVKAQRDPSLVVHSHVGAGALVLVFNTTRPPFDDRRVRQSIVHAIDRKAVSEVWGGGLKPVANDPYGPSSAFACPESRALPYDPARARQLLADYGKPVKASFVHTATARGREIGQLYQHFLKQVGIELELKPVDSTQLVQMVLKRDFLIAPWRIVDLPDPDPQIFAAFFSASPSNWAGYSNPEVDRLLNIGRASLDNATRRRAYCDLVKILNADVPWMWRESNKDYAIAKRSVKGLPKLYGGALRVADSWLAR